MDIIKSLLVIAMGLLLIACSSTTSCPTPTPDPAAAAQLAEAATSINQSLTDLDAMEKAAAPPINSKYLPYPTSSDMSQLVSIDWSGPIQPLLQRIAWMCNYKLRVIGASPPIPVLVTISARDTPVGYILRDANFQAASKASVWVYPGIHVIELRYGKS